MRRTVRRNGRERSYRALIPRLLGVLAFAAAGAIIGLAVGIATPAHAEVAGNGVKLRLMPGQAYDQVDLSGALTGTRAITRAILG